MLGLTILATAFVLSLVWRYFDATPNATDAPLMNTAGGQLGAWFASFTVCLVLVGIAYLSYRGIRKVLHRKP